MAIHLRRELDILTQKILSIGAKVEDALRHAVMSIESENKEPAHDVVKGDILIDRAEVELEEECLKVLALHQPVAADLRFVVAVLKINNDLERIGDLAANIAKQSITLDANTYPAGVFDLQEMFLRAQGMVRDSLNAFVSGDSGLAVDVCKRDDEVDEMKRAIRDRVEKMVQDRPDYVHSLFQILSISRNLERIADQATNIAEDVIYMLEGKIIRHRMQ